jgi:hypothetical protein
MKEIKQSVSPTTIRPSQRAIVGVKKQGCVIYFRFSAPLGLTSYYDFGQVYAPYLPPPHTAQDMDAGTHIFYNQPGC